MITAMLLFSLGMILLIAGADSLVRGASKIASLMGISPLVIGLTVVSFGTSAPEMVVSVISSTSGQSDIAIGNVLGSNIFNVLFILGLSAIILPLGVSQHIVKLDIPVMIISAILLFFISSDGTISRIDGIILFSGMIAYTVFLIYESRNAEPPVQE
ncbi:sodium:calcium antiporter, partial [Achromatium sp. WMS2]